VVARRATAGAVSPAFAPFVALATKCYKVITKSRDAVGWPPAEQPPDMLGETPDRLPKGRSLHRKTDAGSMSHVPTSRSPHRPHER
jgi:hypothetical protein